ncbi:SDR family NAD(P)-dependent oxidoreductase [Haliangium sp.]|uniref:SDR family NAD(P)-dependent oxidoreductase n=1 Tax=Haliangium sp. TaxID=2663208 RepID=UPI003D0B60CF
MTSTELTAVITGGGSGLGRALCMDIARRRGRVVVADIDELGAAETVRQLTAQGCQAHAVRCDVSDPDQVDELATRARQLLGEIDLVANNAGVAVVGEFADISLDDWRWIVDINLMGVVHGCRAFLPAMKERGRGYVINVASLAGLVSFPRVASYNATKAAVVALSETLHGEYRPHGVHLSVVCPSFFRTNIVARGRVYGGDRERRQAHKVMERSQVQAPDVARAAVDAVLAGQLHVLPMRDARTLWRMQRLSPRNFYRWVAGGLNPARLFDRGRGRRKRA